MLQRFIQLISSWLVRFAAVPGNDDLTTQKRMAMAAINIFALLWAMVFGLIFLVLGDWVAAYYMLGTFLPVAILVVIVGRFKLALTGWANAGAAILLTWLFAVTLYRGSFEQSGYILPIWGLMAPMLALVMLPMRHAIIWLLVYFSLIVLATVLTPFFPQHEMSPLVIATLYIANATSVGTILFFTLYYFINQRDSAYRLLHAEQAKSEQLLLNILPAEIAHTLKNEPGIIADHLPAVTVLFADIVGFTPLSARITPVELIKLLNEVFSYMDTLSEKYGLEKIKTVGDCYMAAAGVPRARLDHAQAATHMALEIQEYVRQNSFQNHSLAFRIGIHSGDVVAGVIGTKKFAYDLWGDVVNTASRMEAHGQGGMIQITEATYKLIKDEFVCEPQGMLVVKGKGEMPVWFVVDSASSGQ
jgi:adenylate cyclase